MTDISLKLEIRPDRPIKAEHLTILRIFDDVAQSLNIDYFLAGAQARDLILGHVFNKRTGQATYDLDLGIRSGPVPLNSFPQFISGFSALLKLPLMLVAGF